MAVQAQQYYPSTTATATFSTDHGLINPKAPRLNGGGGHVLPLRPLGTPVPSAVPKLQPGPFNSTTALSGDPGSELTCNNGAPGKRKRAHPLYQMGFHLFPQHNIQQPPPPPLHRAGGDLALGNVPGASWGSLLPSGTSYVTPHANNSRSCDSAMASTTGRPPAEAQIPPGHVAAVPSSPATSLLTQQLVLQFHHQSVDVDDLIRLQNKRLRSEVEQMRERHYRSLLSAMQHGVLRRLRQKVTELDSAKRQNAELEEKVRLMVAENEMWLNVARNNEAIASNLRAGLEQVLLKDANPAGAVTPAVDLEEGYGDSGSVAPTTPRVPEETRYLCFNHGDPPAAVGEEGRKGKQGKCRVCSEGEVSVLVLPCRHLCLCDKCEPRAAACPVCEATINATLHVFFG